MSPLRFDRIHVHHFAAGIFEPALRERLPGREIVLCLDDAGLLEVLDRVEVLFAYRPPRGHWARARRLRFIQMAGAGVDALLPAPDLPEQIVIANTRGIHGGYMSEFALALMLSFAKRLPKLLEQQRARDWRYLQTDTLEGKTLGILGLGSIGAAIAAKARACGMRVIGTCRQPRPIQGVDEVVSGGETEHVLRNSDYVVIALPLTHATRGLLDAEAIAHLRPHAVLINLARGGILDERALALALDRGELGGAALDVFEEEPLPRTSPLWDASNLLLSPHISGWYPGYGERAVEILADNLARLERGEPVRNPIDRERGY
jgi:phosphoglycerate dehydrogenase-like enzyme